MKFIIFLNTVTILIKMYIRLDNRPAYEANDREINAW